MTHPDSSPNRDISDELGALRAIVEETARHTGQEFFQSLVRHLAVTRQHVLEALLRDEDVLVDLVDPLGLFVFANRNVLDGGDAPGLRREV